MADYLLGMDIGTTNMKAILMRTDGQIAASAFRKQKLINPAPGYFEQDAHEWWKSAVEIFQELGRQAGREAVKGIRGICVSSHTVTMLPLDKCGNPVRNAIIWMDSRADRTVGRHSGCCRCQ